MAQTHQVDLSGNLGGRRNTLNTSDGLLLDMSGKWHHTICGLLHIHLLLQA